MKEMSKAKIIDKRSEKSVKSERTLLQKMNHPFIINMHYSFQDKDNLYLVMDLLTGGDLRYHICKNRKFTENQSKFFIACILLSLEFIHSNKIIHRDIKPENLVLDSNGYVHLTDFGIAKIDNYNNCKETSGTPGYMSPEVMCGQNHNIAVDYFAVGVMTYEFMKGFRPYLGRNRKEIKEKILMKQVKINFNNEFCENWSFAAVDFINKLLIRKPNLRLGFNGPKEVKEHFWFKDFNWKQLYLKEIKSDFIPKNQDNFDYKYCNGVEKCGIKTKERYAEIILKDNYKFIFDDYFYFNRYEKKNELYENLHDKLYSDNNQNSEKNKENKNKINIVIDVFNIKRHNRVKSVVNNYSHYSKISNKENVNNNVKNIFEKKKKKSIHIRSTSVSSLNSNQAFFEANSYIESRKLKRQTSIINEKTLNKGGSSFQNFTNNKLVKERIENIKGSQTSRLIKIGNGNYSMTNLNNNINKSTIGISHNSTGFTYKNSYK